MKTFRFICRTALPLLLSLSWAASAQEIEVQASEAPDQIAFSADQLSYDQNADTVTASGEVRMNREGYHLRADAVTWNRLSGEVRAEGNVQVASPGGDVVYGDSVVLEDNLRDGVVQNLLLVLEDGGRLAAAEARREGGLTTLTRAAYTPCAVLDPDGCPREPTWQINAVRVVHDPVRHRISYQGASLNLFGTPIIALPGLSHPDGSQGGGSGLLVPEVRIDGDNGFELSLPYYLRLAPNRDATITPHVFTDVAPMLEAEYRQLTSRGAFQLHGYITYGSRVPLDLAQPQPELDEGIRGYIEGSGRFQLNPAWSITASGRYVTDRTFLRRYDISRDDRLRSMVDAERITANS
ncbi:MAG: LPS-assembly protein LptD, partial [Allosphingosinicella sp.]